MLDSLGRFRVVKLKIADSIVLFREELFKTFSIDFLVDYFLLKNFDLGPQSHDVAFLLVV